MKAQPTVPLELNLATRPVRNRRAFRLLGGVMALILLASIGLVAYTLLTYGASISQLRAQRTEMENSARNVQRERSRYEAEVEKVEKVLAPRVNLVNSIILRKSFSWTGLFSELEAALPDSSYFTVLSPEFRGERSLGLRLRVVSSGLNDLITLIDNLSEKGFTGIQVSDESRSVEGRLITEISLTYDQIY